MREREQFIRFVKMQSCDPEADSIRKLPIRIDEIEIETALDRDTATSASMTSVYGSEQVYYPLMRAQADLDSDCYQFFLTCKVSNFKSCLIWYAATRRQELQQLHMIASYTRTHTYKIVPEIRMDRNQMRIDVLRSTIYPLETLDKHTLRYDIEPDGTILFLQRN